MAITSVHQGRDRLSGIHVPEAFLHFGVDLLDRMQLPRIDLQPVWIARRRTSFLFAFTRLSYA
jgi:hypothetical protein